MFFKTRKDNFSKVLQMNGKRHIASYTELSKATLEKFA